MNIAIVPNGSSQTMTSIEIANLCDKEHKNVIADIRNMFDQLDTDSAEFSAQYKDSTGRTLPCFKLPRDLTLTLVSGYNIVLRKRIIDRMTELEAAALPATKPRAARIPSSHREALGMVKLALSAAKAFGFTGNQAALSADKFITGATGISPLSLMGSTHLIADQRGMTFTPTQLGAERGISGIAMNRLLSECGMQFADGVNGWAPTSAGEKHCEWLDTAKKHSNGTPVKQLKWFASVGDLLGASA